MKICIVTPSLGLGGAERSASAQSKMLTELGYEVHIVLISNSISYEFEGVLYNLGALKDKSNTYFDKIKRISLLKKYLKKNKFDFIIDNRMRTNSIINEIGISKYAYKNFNALYVMHSASYKNEVKEYSYLKKWLLKDAYKIIVVNKKLLQLISSFHDFDKMICIENAVDIDAISLKCKESFNISFPYILFCGRLEEVCKNISLLIKAYALSEIYNSGVKLIILGDGPDKNEYENLVTKLNMKDYVIFEPFTLNPFVYMKHALCTVLTSLYEGFPMVLIESLATGTPVLAINCETGPSEIIEHNSNGILLETYDVNELSIALKRICDDKNHLKTLNSNAFASVQKFSKEHIAKKWQSVLEN